MIVTRLILKNIRSHKNLDIKFPKGRTLLSGDIGAGKTSILYGIEFALFGIMKGWNDGETLLSNDSSTGQVKLYFEINNIVLEIERSLKRTPKGISQGDVLMNINGEQYKLVPTEARSKILELLKYPQEFITKNPIIFRYTVYTPQERMREILSDDSNIRMNILRKLFGIDKYQIIRENASIFSSNLKSIIRYYEGQTINLPQLENELSVITEKNKEINLVETEKKASLEKIRENLELQRKKCSDMESYAKLQEEHKRQLLEIHTKIIELKKEIETHEKNIILKKDISSQTNLKITQELKELGLKYEDNDKIREEIKIQRIEQTNKRNKIRVEYESINQQLRTKENEINNITKKHELLLQKKSFYTTQIEDSQNKLLYVKEEIETMDKELLKYPQTEMSSLSSAKAEAQQKYDERKQELTRINTNISTLSSDLSNLLSLNFCPTCKQTVDEAHKKKSEQEVNQKVKELEDNRKEIINLTANSKNLIDDIEKNILLTNESKNIKFKKEELLKQMNEIESKRGENNKNIILLNSEIEELFSLIPPLNSAQKILQEKIINTQNTLADIEKILMKLEEIRNLFDTTEISEREIMSITEKLAENKSRQHEYETSKDLLDKSIKEKNLYLESYDKVKEELKIAETENEEMLKEHSYLIAQKKANMIRTEEINGKISEATQTNKKREKIKQLKDFFDNKINEITKHIEMEKSRNIHSHMESRLSKWFSLLVPDLEVNLSENFTPIAMQNGFITSFNNLSGGERTSLSLAYRMALNDTVNHAMLKQNSGLLILDEPTDGFSSEQMDQVKILLDQVPCEQLIIVSHEQKMESFVENIIRIQK